MKKLLLLITITGITRFGFNQTALHFDGVDDYVQTYYQGIIFGDDRTFEAWIFVDTPATTSSLTILDYGKNVTGGRNTFSVEGNKSLAYTSGGTTNVNISSSANAIPVGQWTHVAFVKQLGTGFLYVNGIQVGTGLLTGVNTPSPFSGEQLKIGERVAGGSNPFKGRIDEVRIWDKARTATEILANMNAEYCAIQHWRLDAYYRFNEGLAGGTNTNDTITFDYGRIFHGNLKGFALTGSSSNYVSGPALTPGYSKTLFKDSVCSSFTTGSGKIFTTSGFYFDTLKNAVFCDSLIEYDLTITSVDDSVYLWNNKLFSNDPGAQYQWVDCNNSYAPISGETNSSYTPTTSGKFAVVVSRGACNDTSDCFKINMTSISKNLVESISFYPNPTDEVLNIQSQFSLVGSEIYIYAMNGKLIQSSVLTNSRIDVSDLLAGMYYLQINTNQGTRNMKFIKK